jgi:hypothetical protein
MGCSECCSKNNNPKCLSIIGLVHSIVGLGFLIWGITDLEFKRNAIKTLYIITFILLILDILGFISVLILSCFEKSKAIKIAGKIISIIILVLSSVADLFLIISFIVLCIDYFKFHSILKHPEDYTYEDILDNAWGFLLDDVVTKGEIAGHEWCALFFPAIIALSALSANIRCGKGLYDAFKDDNNTDPQIQANTGYNQNTIGVTVPNMNQPGLFPNNNGPVPPMGNNPNSQVEIKQN